MGATKNQISYFLNQFAHKVRTSGIFYFEEDLKNVKTLLISELPVSVRREAVLQLNPDNYIVGPISDRKFNGLPFWGFGKLIRKHEYIIKISLGLPESRALCSSFHTADYPILYPAQKTPHNNEKPNNRSINEAMLQK